MSQKLRGHVRQGASAAEGDLSVIFGHPEVANMSNVTAVDHNVLGLDIAVNDSLAVDVFQSINLSQTLSQGI